MLESGSPRWRDADAASGGTITSNDCSFHFAPMFIALTLLMRLEMRRNRCLREIHSQLSKWIALRLPVLDAWCSTTDSADRVAPKSPSSCAVTLEYAC